MRKGPRKRPDRNGKASRGGPCGAKTPTSTVPSSSAPGDPAASPSGLILEQLGRVLLKKGYVSTDQLEVALGEHERVHKPLGRTLVDLGFITGMELVRALSLQHRLEYISVEDCLIDPRTLARVPCAVATRHRMLPLLEIGDTLFVGVEETNERVADYGKMARDVRRQVEAVTLPPDLRAENLIEKAYRTLRTRRFRDERIGEFLVERGRMTTDEVEEILDQQRRSGRRFGEILEASGNVTAREFHELLSEHLGIPYVMIQEVRGAIDAEVAKVVPRTFAEHNLIVPFRATSDEVHILTSSKPELWLEEWILSCAQREACRLYLATPSDVRLAIREVHEPNRVVEDQAEYTRELSVSIEDVGDFKDVEFSPTEDVEIPHIVNHMLYKALERRASDVHIERYESRVLVRFRIDGVLRDVDDLPIARDNVHRVLTKLKIDAHLDIAERRRPQDGAVRKRFGSERDVDFRLAFQPTIHGENVVIRILDRSKPLPSLEEIGFGDDVLGQYLRLLENPQGMILFTGPTGSGKTTSLYATLDRMRELPINIVTAEDPVEYNFERIQQCQTNEAIGNTFARYLRGFLRQDPDVILIGEMRDEETANIGIQAAITGHLLFSTLHTNDAVSTVSRLLLLGIESDMLATGLLCVVSQRLVRRICNACRETYRPKDDVLAEFFPDGVPDDVAFSRGAGCGACEDSGFKGRLPIFEFWAPNAEAKSRIRQGIDDSALADLAFATGMSNILDDGMRKMRSGLTTLEELRRVIPYTQLVWYQERAPNR